MWKSIVLTAASLLLGCQTIGTIKTTRNLSTLQAEYGDLVRTEAACEANDEHSDLCVSDFPALYSLIEAQADDAIQARSTAQTVGEQQITIGLYRLAAFAALKSNSGKAADYGDGGMLLCNALNIKPPRDCAVLQVVGQYELLEQYVVDVDCLGAGGGPCGRSFDAAASDFCLKVYKPLEFKTATAKSDPLLPPVVAAYLDRQVDRARVSQQALATHLTKELGFNQRPREPCDCVDLDEADPHFANLCGDVRANRQATFKAMCVRKALDDGKPCPTL